MVVITAIRAVRAQDPEGRIWAPLLPTSAFPEYVSSDSISAAAAAELLCLFFATDRLPFTVSTDSKDVPGVTRLYPRFSAAADEAGMSRIWGGVHFLFSHQDGQTAGRQVSDAVFAQMLRPTGETPPAPQACPR